MNPAIYLLLIFPTSADASTAVSPIIVDAVSVKQPWVNATLASAPWMDTAESRAQLMDAVESRQ